MAAARASYPEGNRQRHHRAYGGDVQTQQGQTLPGIAWWPLAPAGVALPSMYDGVNESSAANPHNVTIKRGYRKHKGLGGVGQSLLF